MAIFETFYFNFLISFLNIKMTTKPPHSDHRLFDIIDKEIQLLSNIDCQTIKTAVTKYIDSGKDLYKNIGNSAITQAINLFENNVDLSKKIIKDFGPLTGKINCVIDGINNSNLNLDKKLQYKDVSDIEYSVVKAIIDNNKDVKEKVFRDSGSLLYMILAIVFFIIILILVFFMVMKKRN